MSSSGGHPETPEKSPVGDPESSQAIVTESPTLSDINAPAAPIKGQMQSPSGSWQGSTPQTPGSANSRKHRQRESTVDSRHSPGYLLPEGNLGAELARAFGSGDGSDDGSDDKDIDVAKEEVEAKAEDKEEMKADTPTSDDIYAASPLASSRAKESAAEAGNVGKGGGGEKELEEEERPIYAEDDMNPVSRIKSPGPQSSLSEVSKPDDSKPEAEVESNDNDGDVKTEEQEAEDKGRDKGESQPSPQTKPDTDITLAPRSAAPKDSTREEEERDDKTGGDTVKPDSPAPGHNNAPTSPTAISSSAKASISSTSNLTTVTGRASLPSQQRVSEAAMSSTPPSASQPQQKKRPAAPPPRASYTLNTTMEQARTEAKNMFRPLLERIEHERLWTNGDSLRDIRLRMQEDIKTLDMEQAENYAMGFVQKFEVSFETRDRVPEFWKEWRHVFKPVMNQLWNSTLHKAKEVALSYIRYLINNVYSTCVDFNECMVGVRNRLPASTRANSMLSSPRRMPGLSRRQSQDSASSDPESVLNPRDRGQLSKARPEQLVDRVLLQIQQLDAANNQIYQHEQTMGEMQKKIDKLMAEVQQEQVQLRLAKKRHVRELEEVQKEADIRVESAVKSPAARIERIIRPRDSAKTHESDENAMLPLPDPSIVAAIMSPQEIEQARFASRRLEQQETASKNRYFEQIQNIMVMIHEEGDLTKSYVEKIGHRVAYSVQSRSESDWTQQLSGEVVNPSSGVSESTNDQLSTQLRIAIEERDAMRQERDKYREEAAMPHTIEHLESAERKRVLQMAQRALKVVDENIDNLVQGSQHLADFALVAVEVGRPEAGQQACATELRAVLDLSEKLKSSRPEHYNSGIVVVGGLSMLDTYQDFWLPQTEDFVSLSREFVRALVSLGRKAQTYYAATSQPLESPLSKPPSSGGPLTRILSGEGLFFESPEQISPMSVRNTTESPINVQRSPGDRQLSNTSASAPEITSATIQTSPVRVHPRNVPTASLFETLDHAVPRRHSSRATKRRERADRKSSVQTAPDTQFPGINNHASNAGEGDGLSEDWQPVEQHGDNEDASDAYSIRREAQPEPNLWPGSSSYQHSANDRIPQHPVPTGLRAQVQQFIWWLVRFLTIAQVYNALTILQFVGLLGWYKICLPLLERRYLRRGLLQHMVLPMPREEIISLAMWCLVMLHFLGLLAIHEERRIWLAANARTASYIRGLQHRSPYPLSPLYEVDYRLVVPAWKSSILRLLDVYFRPVLIFLLGGQ